MAEKVKCSVCGRIVSGRIPKGGDGSILFPYRHKKTINKDKLAWFEYCPGYRQFAKELHDELEDK